MNDFESYNMTLIDYTALLRKKVTSPLLSSFDKGRKNFCSRAQFESILSFKICAGKFESKTRKIHPANAQKSRGAH